MLEAFHIFDTGMVPEEEKEEFEVFGNDEPLLQGQHRKDQGSGTPMG